MHYKTFGWSSHTPILENIFYRQDMLLCCSFSYLSLLLVSLIKTVGYCEFKKMKGNTHGLVWFYNALLGFIILAKNKAQVSKTKTTDSIDNGIKIHNKIS